MSRLPNFSLRPNFRVLVLHALDFCYFLVFVFFALASPRFASNCCVFVFPSRFAAPFCFRQNVISSRTVFSILHILFVYNDFMLVSFSFPMVA